MPCIFVSHSHYDNQFCRAFVKKLLDIGSDRNLEIWYDEDSLGAGQIRQNIERELLRCDYFVAIMSPSSTRSPWVHREIDLALNLLDSGNLKGFLLVIAEKCEIPWPLTAYKYVESGSSPEKAAQDVYDMFFVREETTIIKPQAKVVTSQDDPDIDDFFDLYEDLFPNLMERACVDDMKRYVQESQEEKAKPEPKYLEELVLVMNRGRVMAFMNYTFYTDCRFVLVSYIGVRKPLKTQLKQAVMSALINYFKDTMLSNDCLCVVFEAENVRDKRELEPSRIRVFRRYLKEYAGMEDVHCYRVEFNFIQPLLMIEDVIERTQGNRGLLDRFIRRNGSSAQSPQNLGIVDLLSLGFIPLQSGFVSGKMISKGKLMSILQFVYRKVYGDSFIENLEEDKIYKDYMEELLRYYEKTLPKEIAISERA